MAFKEEQFLDFFITHGTVRPKPRADEHTRDEQQWHTGIANIVGNLSAAYGFAQHVFSFLEDDGIDPHAFVGRVGFGVANKLSWILQTFYWQKMDWPESMELAELRLPHDRAKHTFYCTPKGPTLYLDVLSLEPHQFKRDLEAIAQESRIDLIGALVIVEPHVGPPGVEGLLANARSQGLYAESMIERPALIEYARQRILEGTHPHYRAGVGRHETLRR